MVSLNNTVACLVVGCAFEREVIKAMGSEVNPTVQPEGDPTVQRF